MFKKMKKIRTILLMTIMLFSLFSTTTFFVERAKGLLWHNTESGNYTIGCGFHADLQVNCTNFAAFKLHLSEGWNYFNFTGSDLDCLSDYHPETVFASIDDHSLDIVFDNTTYDNYWFDVAEGDRGGTLTTIENDTEYAVKVNEDCILTIPFTNFTVTRTVGANTEKNNFSTTIYRQHSGNVTIKLPVSSDVRGIANVTNNIADVTATEVNNTDDLVNNTFWYDSTNQFVHIRIDDILIPPSKDVAWTVNCSYGANFSILVPQYLEVGDIFMASGLIKDGDGVPIDGFIAKTRILYQNGTDALSISPEWNCTNGNYICQFSTSSLIPGTYHVSIEFTDSSTGITFKEGSTLYLSVDPSSDVHVTSNLHFTFYNNNTGMGINSESFKIYVDDAVPLDSSDRIYRDTYKTYTGATIYYNVTDYFDNQVYPKTGTNQTLTISSTEQFEDVPIDWHSFSVKNMNHSIVWFNMTNGSRVYSKWLFPYEPWVIDVLEGEYNLSMRYYNPITDAYQETKYQDITITHDEYYWIRGYDLNDIIIEVIAVNSTLGIVELNITADISIVNSTVSTIETNVITNLSAVNTSIHNVVYSVWNAINITDSVVDYINATIWSEINAINITVDTINNKLTINFTILNSTVTYLNNTIWANFTAINTTIVTQSNTIQLVVNNWGVKNYNIVTNELIAYWMFDEVSGTTCYDEIGYNNATLTGTYSRIPGKISNSIELDGSTGYTRVPATENLDRLNISENITITVWCKPYEISGTQQYIFNKRHNSATVRFTSYNLEWISGRFKFHLNNGTSDVVLDTAPNTYAIDNWYFVTCMWDKSTSNMSIWVNGEFITNTTKTGDTTFQDTQLFYIGGFDDTPEFYGAIDEIRIYNRTLTASEIEKLYHWSSPYAYIHDQFNTVTVSITNTETNITNLTNNVWLAVNLTNSIASHINNTIWANLTFINTTVDNINNTITIQLDFINVTTNYLNNTIWTNFTFIQSLINNSNISIKNIITLMESNVTRLIITIDNIINYALMPDEVIWSYNPPTIFSAFDRMGMLLGQNVWKVCPPKHVIATTRNSTYDDNVTLYLLAPENDSSGDGEVSILYDDLHLSGNATWVNLTYADNNTLIQNTSYVPGLVHIPLGVNISINASRNIFILRETTYSQVKKFNWDIYNSTNNPGFKTGRGGYHIAGIDVVNSLDVPIYNVFVLAGFSDKTTPDPSTARVRDVENGVLLERGDDFKTTGDGIEFWIKGGIPANTTRNFTLEYYSLLSSNYVYSDEQIDISTYETDKVYGGQLYYYRDFVWSNKHNLVFKGGLRVKLDIRMDVDEDSILVHDLDNSEMVNVINGEKFIWISQEVIGSVSPGGTRNFGVYWQEQEDVGGKPGYLHLSTIITYFLGIPITPFFGIFVLFCIPIIVGGVRLIKKRKYDPLAVFLIIVIGVVPILIFWILQIKGL
jgi:hypothetical protein